MTTHPILGPIASVHALGVATLEAIKAHSGCSIPTMLAQINARALEVPEFGQWQPIETAPIIDTGLIEIPRCLVYSEKFGVQMGRAWRYTDGEACGQGSGFNGEWNVTHWMPLPSPPTGETP